MKVSFKKRYFIPVLLVLVAEITIAVFHFHRFVRGFLGDVLAIPLLYYLLRAISSIRHRPAIIAVITFAFLIEGLQLLDLTKLISTNNPLFLLVMGNTFDGLDLVAYVIGGIVIYLIEKPNKK